MVGKRGWLRIVEASISILIILAAILIIYGNVKSNVTSNSNIEEMINPILLEIAQNSSLRNSILTYDLTQNTSNNAQILLQLDSFLETKIKSPTLRYKLEICRSEDFCALKDQIKEDLAIYTDSYLITSNLSSFSPRKIKLYIWEKV